jgi:hypothetical protein
VPNGALSIVVVLVFVHSVGAQTPGGEVPAIPSTANEWTPLGRLPVDQAGAGLRGYALPGESAEVTGPGTGQVSVHAIAGNNFYFEQTAPFLISERYETHTLALGYRRGFTSRFFRRFEVGGQIQFVESDRGFLNGFISGFETIVASLTGESSAKNPLRAPSATAPALGTRVSRASVPVYQADGDGSGIGDLSFMAKALVRGGGSASNGTRVAARLVANISGKSQFTSGNFAGVGLSVDQKLSTWAALHGDVRAAFALDRVSQWTLPLKPASLGFSVGSEMKLTQANSLGVQVDGSTTPYETTGTTAFDKGYGDLTLGVSHRAPGGRLLTQLYVRENMNLPFGVRWNLDPDLALGLKFTLTVR